MQTDDVSRRGAITLAAALGVGPALAPSNPKKSPEISIRPESFGAIADGAVDCTNAFERALKSARQIGTVAGRQRNVEISLAAGVYRLTRPLQIEGQDIRVFGAGGQNTALLFDHAGPGLVYVGEGDSLFEGFALTSTAARQGTAGAAEGFISDPGRPKNQQPRTTVRLTLRDLHVQRQPGDGIVLINPEGARLENVTSSLNGGSGCILRGRDLDNILNLLDFCRFRDNGQHGFVLDNISTSIISRVECLNNRSGKQMVVDGSYNHIIQPDCEAFDLSLREGQKVGLTLRGHGNQVVGGTFYKIDTGIVVEYGRCVQIVLPRLEGAKDRPIKIGISVDAKAESCYVQLANFNYVEKPVENHGRATQIDVAGRQRLVRPGLQIIETSHEQSVLQPDLAAGHTFRVNGHASPTILPPRDLLAGDILIFIIDLHDKVSAPRFSPAYRGAAGALLDVKNPGCLVLSFIALSETELILSNACHSR